MSSTTRHDGLVDVKGVIVPRHVNARSISTGKHYRYAIESQYSSSAIDKIEQRVSWRARTPERRGHAKPPADPIEASTWQIHPVLDAQRMKKAADILVGTHDFSAFRSARCGASTTRRTIHSIAIQSQINTNNPRYILDIIGDGFLRQMIRIIVGTLVEVGIGARDPRVIKDILASKQRRNAGLTAPSRGLTLMEIFTQTDWFNIDKTSQPCTSQQTPSDQHVR